MKLGPELGNPQAGEEPQSRPAKQEGGHPVRPGSCAPASQRAAVRGVLWTPAPPPDPALNLRLTPSKRRRSEHLTTVMEMKRSHVPHVPVAAPGMGPTGHRGPPSSVLTCDVTDKA